MKFVMFDDAHFDKGMKTIVASGIVVWTAEPHIYGVPDETARVLKRKRIPFKVVSYEKVTEMLAKHFACRTKKTKRRKLI